MDVTSEIKVTMTRDEASDVLGALKDIAATQPDSGNAALDDLAVGLMVELEQWDDEPIDEGGEG